MVGGATFTKRRDAKSAIASLLAFKFSTRHQRMLTRRVANVAQGQRTRTDCCMKETDRKRKVKGALGRARTHSPFLRQQLERFPGIEAALAAGGLDRALDQARAQALGHEVSAALRRERSAFALALGIGDLAGLLTFEQVTAELSELADRSLQQAIAAAIAERTPGEDAIGFAAIALGKLGGHELNYSSDVDLVLLYDPAKLPRRAREEAGQAALRVAQR